VPAGRITTQHADRGAHDIDGRGTLRGAREKIDDALRQLALGAKGSGERLELSGIRETTMPEEMDDFLIAHLPGELIDIVPAVDELADLPPYVSDLSFSSDDTFQTARD
jgi:hypothetical protein